MVKEIKFKNETAIFAVEPLGICLQVNPLAQITINMLLHTTCREFKCFPIVKLEVIDVNYPYATGPVRHVIKNFLKNDNTKNHMKAVDVLRKRKQDTFVCFFVKIFLAINNFYAKTIVQQRF